MKEIFYIKNLIYIFYESEILKKKLNVDKKNS